MNKKNKISYILDNMLVILLILLIVFIWFKIDEFLWLKIIVTVISTIIILFYIIKYMINDDFDSNQELIKLFMMKNDMTKNNKCTLKKGKKEISVQIEPNNTEIEENSVDSEKEILKNILKELKKIQEELNKWEKKK